MQATLTMCWFTPGWMYFGHIGDSRLYYLPAREKALRQLSHDDTHVGWLFRHGQISEREARSIPGAPRCRRRSGRATSSSSRRSGRWLTRPGDLFLLCTDGVVDGLYDDQLLELLRAGEADSAPRLVRQAVENSGRDNTTAVVIEAV